MCPKTVFNTVRNVVNTVTKPVRNVLDDVGDVVHDVAKPVTNVITDVTKPLGQAAHGAIGATINVASDAAQGAAGVASDVVGPVFEAVGDVVEYGIEKGINTVKDVSGITKAENEAKEAYQRAQAQADAEAKAKQEELNRLAKEREALLAQQKATLQAQELRLVQQQKTQEELVTGLRAEQKAKVGRARASGQAVTNSLKILAQKSKKAPTAQVSKKKGRTPRPRSTTAGLRLGGGQSGAGAGTNYSV